MQTGISGVPLNAAFAATVTLPPGSASADLQTAINSAASGDIIQVSSDMAMSAVVTIPAGKEITVQSDPGNGWVLLKTVANARHFAVNGDLILQNVTLYGGGIGGGIVVNSSGSFAMSDGTVIRSCLAANGGGVQVNNGGRLTVTGGVITENRSSGASSGNGGGGVYGGATGVVVVTGGVISNNTAAYSGGGVHAYAIEIGDGVLISGNTAARDGGGVYVNTGGSLQMTGATITGNAANGTSTTNGGGGIYGYTNSIITINGGTIGNNVASAGGGGVFGYTNSTIAVSGNAVIGGDTADDGNTAVGYGGGVYGYSNSTVTAGDSVKISYNSANNGGGIACAGSSSSNASRVTVSARADISNNRATGRGGGIGAFSTTGTASVPHEVTIVDEATVTGNTAGSGGGGIYVYNGGILQVGGGQIRQNGAGNGGGIYGSNNSLITFTGGSMTLNEAAGNGGGIFIISSRINILGGAIYNNKAAGIGGGICSYHDFRGASSSVGITYTSQIIVAGGGIIGNGAANGGGIGDFNAFDSAGNNNVAECFITVEGGDISGNTATENGGGIYNYGYSSSGSKIAAAEVSVMGGSIAGNTAGGNGGGVYSYSYGGSGATVRANCLIAVEDGGSVTNNTAALDGGGICGVALTGSACRIVADSGIVSNNTAMARGGGIYATAVAAVEIAGMSSITNNNAPNGNGGGIYTEAVTYGNLITGGDTVFGGNSASAAYTPPANALLLYPNIQFASTSIANHPLNNYDINFTSGAPLAFYHIVYNANGGTGGYIGPDTLSGGMDTVLSPEEAGISREGYVFTGWNTDPEGGGASYAPGDALTLTGNVILYAQWTANLFAVTYNANGGVGGYEDTGVPYGALYTVLSPEEVGISREGYVFAGWNIDPEGGGASYVPGDVIFLTGDVSLYAQWTVSLFAVTYHANGGIGGYEDTGVPYGALYTVLSPEAAGVSREGYVFTGWNTDPEGGGASYAPGDVLTLTGDVILYAQWMVNLFVVTYNANGGVGGYADTGIPYGALYTVLSPEEVGVSREGYVFAGWNTEPEGGGVSYVPGDVIFLTGDVLLYAQWTAGLFAVTYNANGGVGGYADTGVPYGVLYTVLSPEEAGISRQGYVFAGWNTDPEGGGVSYAPGDVISLTGDVILYARWMAAERPSPSYPPPYWIQCCMPNRARRCNACHARYCARCFRCFKQCCRMPCCVRHCKPKQLEPRSCFSLTSACRRP